MNINDFEVFVHGKFGVTPIKAEGGSVGFDIALPENAGAIYMPYNSRRLIDTGIIIKPPTTCFSLVVPRSSSRKKNVTISNTVGIIDPSYCGKNDTLKVDVSRGGKKSEYLTSIDMPSDVLEDPEAWEAYVKQYCADNVQYAQQIHLAIESAERVHIYIEDHDQPLVFEAKERFCQVLFIPFHRPDLVEKTLEFFDCQDRGGFGSTGKF